MSLKASRHSVSVFGVLEYGVYCFREAAAFVSDTLECDSRYI